MKNGVARIELKDPVAPFSKIICAATTSPLSQAVALFAVTAWTRAMGPSKWMKESVR